MKFLIKILIAFAMIIAGSYFAMLSYTTIIGNVKTSETILIISDLVAIIGFILLVRIIAKTLRDDTNK